MVTVPEVAQEPESHASHRSEATEETNLGQETAAEADEPTCRICFEVGKVSASDDEDDLNDPHRLIVPCKCKGTQKYVHVGCLERWQGVTLREANPRRAIFCSVCNTKFKMAPSFLTCSPNKSRAATNGNPRGRVSWIATYSRRVVWVSIIAAVVHQSRQLPGVLHVLAVVTALLAAMRLSSVAIADGDPVPGVYAGRYLIGDRIPAGSIFHQSVVLLLEHGPHGTLGVIVNNPRGIGGPVPSHAPVYLQNFAQTQCQEVAEVEGLYWGRGAPNPFDIFNFSQEENATTTPHGSTAQFAEEGSVQGSGRDGSSDGRKRKVLRGVCGWAPRQLDGEMRRGGWRIIDADIASALELEVPEMSQMWARLYSHHDSQGSQELLGQSGRGWIF